MAITALLRRLKVARREYAPYLALRAVFQRGNVWWIRYYRSGKRYEESSESDKKSVAITLLKTREGDIARGIPVTPQRLTFDDALKAVVDDYTINGKRSVVWAKIRLENHLELYSSGRKMHAITTPMVRAYATQRREEGAANATINRELALLKRAFGLAMKDGLLLARQHVPMLEEDNVRRGFFEPEQFEDIRQRLPKEAQPVATFGYVIGWRVPSEILRL